MTDPTDKFSQADRGSESEAELQTARRLCRWLPEIPHVPLRQSYELTGRVLGTGGYGRVVEARKLRLPQRVAIKQIQSDADFSESDQRRFIREMQLLAPLQHPNLVQIEDWGWDDDGLYIVMELIDGPNLQDVVRQEGRLPVQRLLNFAAQICSALQCAHQQGILHRNVKPLNLLLDPGGVVKLADFGLARESADLRERVTSSRGTGLGTFAYASPEQLRGDQQLDGRSDLFSLGATLYHLAAGDADFSRAFDLDDLGAEYQSLRGLFSSLLRPQREKRAADASSVLQMISQLQDTASVGKAAAGVPTVTAAAGAAGVSAVIPPVRPQSGEPDLEELLRLLQGRVQAQHDAARELLAGQRYAEAVAALEVIPEELRHQLDQSLYRECIALRDEVHGLDREISGSVNSLRTVGLRGRVQRLLQLQSWREDLQRLLVTLPEEVVAPPAPAPAPAPVAVSALVLPFSTSAAKSAQTGLSRQLGQAEEWSNDLGMKFRLIPGGTFGMGSATGQGSDAERPQHKVTISRGFYFGVHTVTQGQWQKLMGTTPWQGRDFVKIGGKIAATYISWEDSVEFCQRLSARDGRRYRLPTEAEWEWSCRAGTTTQYSFGDDERLLDKYTWYGGIIGNGNCRKEPYAHAVGQKLANPFGLHDMHGNVWEWCSDWYDSEYYGKSPEQDPAGPASGSLRVVRGGGWDGGPVRLRSCNRTFLTPDSRRDLVGLRVLCELE
jgi:formylglycine-generating enzyme required for sulfatase activity